MLSLDGLKDRVEVWKGPLGTKELSINVENMKMIISREKALNVRRERKIHCIVFRKD